MTSCASWSERPAGTGRAWTALMAFNKGAFFVYAGQEAEAVETPSLFEKQPIAWGNYTCNLT